MTKKIKQNAKDELTEIVFILDRSGSMCHLTNDTIGGYNSFIKEQQKLPDKANLTTILFDDNYEVLHDRVNINDVNPITNKEYCARGTTALLDAVGKTIKELENHINNTDEKPSKVIFIITTDGEENASKEYTYHSVKKLVEEKQEKDKWEFIFLGADMDAVSVGSSFGIRGGCCQSYSATGDGTDSVFTTMSCSVDSYRTKGVTDFDSLKDNIK